ncbi:general odorant-binding protein 99a [Scaptodrosophila lebanonensis]|uniref:General odorant-binding protein 99a n=1 Tax=Drosophila lebanonensis TaxID=7225 RepID=A0A6J2T3R7_DROLE|nr:general odorant-binding protein 99a [Scaptodrosophila lebanonensis]
MKFFVAICVLISLTSAEYAVKNRDNLLAYREECVKELSVPADLVEKYKQWDYPNDEKTQCYLKCVFIKFELFDTQTGFNVENIHAQLARGDVASHDDELHRKIAGCVDNNEQGSNACEWAYRGASCLLKTHLQLVQQSLVPKA